MHDDEGPTAFVVVLFGTKEAVVRLQTAKQSDLQSEIFAQPSILAAKAAKTKLNDNPNRQSKTNGTPFLCMAREGVPFCKSLEQSYSCIATS